MVQLVEREATGDSLRDRDSLVENLQAGARTEVLQVLLLDGEVERRRVAEVAVCAGQRAGVESGEVELAATKEIVSGVGFAGGVDSHECFLLEA